MLAIWRIVLFAAVGLWLYANFGLLGLGTHYVHSIYILVFMLQLAIMLVGYLLWLSNGEQKGTKEE